MQATKKCSTSGCIHWSWQEGQCKFHYANSRRARSPSLGSPYEFLPELYSSGVPSARRASSAGTFDVKKIMQENGETTFTMIKPDAAQHLNVVQAIASRFMKEGFSILEYRKIRLTSKVATELYAIHKEKMWFSELLAYVTGGPCVIFALKKDNAIQDLRKLVGPTDPVAARLSEPDTLRALYGADKQSNAIHCSDSRENADRELNIFFPCNMFNDQESSSSSSPSSSSSFSSSSSSSSAPTTPLPASSSTDSFPA